MKKIKLIFFLILLLSSIVSASDLEIAHFETATVYYNSACGMCTHYLDSELLPLLDSLGVKEIIKKDYVNDQKNRAELIQRSDELGVPPKLQGHFTIMIGNKIILEGRPRLVLFPNDNKD